MESKESGEVSRPTELNSIPPRDSGGNTPENQDRGYSYLAVDIRQAANTAKPIRVILGISNEPSGSSTKSQLILDMVKDTRCK